MRAAYQMRKYKPKAGVKLLLSASVLTLGMMLGASAYAAPKAFNIPSEEAVKAIPEFGLQAGVQIVAPSDRLNGVHTPAVKGNFEPRDALARLLNGTGLEVASDDGRVIVLHFASVQPANSPAQTDHALDASSHEAVPEILVQGSRTLDVDIRRTRDDIQPYVVFNSAQISQSGAQNIEDFLQSHLPMNAQQTTISQIGPQTLATGRIDLRGLGPNQTLILVDGRRLPSVSTGDSFAQPNVNGISMSQIERIEILPATASGIYGGGATGGVINIILKRNYSGLDIDASYGNAFDTDVGQRRLGVNGGMTLEHGRTHILFSASRSDANTLLSTDRDFFRRGAQLQLRNDPSQPNILFGGANICSTDDDVTCSTQPLTLLNGAALASSFTSIPTAYSGPANDGGAGLAANAGRLQFDRAGVPIWSAPTTTAYSFDLRRKFNDRIEAFVDVSRDQSKTTVIMPTQWTELVPAGAPDNPFQQDVLSFLSIPNGHKQIQSVNNTRVNVGAIINLPKQWSALVEYDWLRNTTNSSNSVVLGPASADADAVLQNAVFRDIATTPLNDPNSLFTFFTQSGPTGDILQTGSLRMSGPVVKLPGGDLTATILLEHRDETSDSTVALTSYGQGDAYSWTPKAQRTVQSEYFELRAPIFSEGNKIPWVHSLDLMGSVRHDAYKTVFSGSSISIDGPAGPFPAQDASRNNVSSTDYTVGFSYAPISDVTFRASYGTGFLPPNLSQIRGDPPNVFSPFLIYLLDLHDPARGNDLIPGPLTVLAGGAPDLKPERSKSASFGLVLTPHVVSGLRVSVDFTSIDKTDEIAKLPLAYFIENESAFPGRVVRGSNLAGDAPGEPGPITQIDMSSLNLASSALRAVDIQADYWLPSQKFGTWHVYAVATNTIKLSHKVLPTDASVDRADYADGPLKWRGNLGVDWNYENWKAGWNAQYYSSNHVCSSYASAFVCNQQEMWQGSSRIPSQIYHDVYLRYSFAAKSGALAGADVSLAINNVFDNKGPTIASGIANLNGPASFVDPRLRRFTVALHKHF